LPIRTHAVARRLVFAALVAVAPFLARRAATDETIPPVEGAAEPGDAAPSFFDGLWEAVSGGDVGFNLRVRGELVEQTGLDTARALTERVRLGYETRPFHGFSARVEFEDIRTPDDDRFNAAGLNANPRKAVVADPEDTELNQGFFKYAHEYAAVVAGRQRITLDDHRFVGDVGWRQNEQTYDAFTLSSNAIPDTTLFYGYLADVNRVFGPSSGRDFESDSHLFNASYNGLSCGKLTAFAYLLDFDNAAANSSDTYGLRFAGKQAIAGDFSTTYAASYAHQNDAGDNPVDYDAEYFFLEAMLAVAGVGSGGAGYELLGSDDSAASFATPLATLHKFNGFADVFLQTPVAGLQDAYAKAGTKLPCDVSLTAFFHWFWTDDTSAELGNELDFVVEKPWTKNVKTLLKVAIFDGSSGLPDREVYWLQTEIDF